MQIPLCRCRDAMISVTVGSKSPEAAAGILERYRSESGTSLELDPGSRLYLASEDGETMGFVIFRNGRMAPCTSRRAPPTRCTRLF